VTRLFITLPDPLPENLAEIAWRLSAPGLPSTQSNQGVAASAADLPKADEIWLALPASRVLLSRLTLSRRALRQLNGALGNALEDQLMLDPVQSHVVLGKPLPGDVHPVAVIEIAWMEQVLALCRRQGVEPFGAIPETLLWVAEAAQEQWCARWHGQGGFVRSDACAGFALDDGDAATPPLALQLALAEARRTGTSPAAITLESDMPVDVAAWNRNLEIPVNLQSLREDPLPPTLNLLQGPYASRRRGSRGWFIDLAGSQQLGKYRLAAGLMVAALGVHVIGTLADWARLSYENRQLRGEMRQVFQEAFPQTRAIVDPTLQMQRQLADMRRARGYVATGDFLHATSAVAGQVSGVNGLTYESGRLTLLQPRGVDLDGLRAALISQGYQMATSGEPGNQSVSIERSPQ
jgi:general secretion pathway protein L